MDGGLFVLFGVSGIVCAGIVSGIVCALFLIRLMIRWCLDRFMPDQEIDESIDVSPNLENWNLNLDLKFGPKFGTGKSVL